MRGPDSRSQVSAVSSPGRQRVVRRNFAGPEMLLDLQRTHGNAFVQRLVRRKLAVRRHGEKYEREADRLAEAVVGKTDISSSLSGILRQAELGVRPMCAEGNNDMEHGSPQ